MRGNGDKRGAEESSGRPSHEAFLELCAVSTTGELSGEERQRLQEHLSICAECRQALREFEAAVDIGIPALTSELARCIPNRQRKDPSEFVEATTSGPTKQLEGIGPKPSSKEPSEIPIFAQRDGRGCTSMNWSYVWISLAAAVVLAAALGIYSYQFGKHNVQEVVQTTTHAVDTGVETLEQLMSDAGHEREVLKAQLVQRDEVIVEMRRQIAEQSAVLNEIKGDQANLEHSLRDDQAEKQQVAQERNSFQQKLDATEASLQNAETELDALKRERLQVQSRAESLEAQIRDLHGQLHDREQELGKQQDLLARDQDIRDLMGARELYIAEVYDVARDGTTQKPYGRVFYTKGKSLIFYAYDLDQQPGVKNASTFQAWGRGGPDRQEVLSLGVFYEDNAAKKRWVLKFDDRRTLDQLDAVFVTVEPHGGSRKPTNKPLLFASLRIEANHP